MKVAAPRRVQFLATGVVVDPVIVPAAILDLARKRWSMLQARETCRLDHFPEVVRVFPGAAHFRRHDGEPAWHASWIGPASPFKRWKAEMREGSTGDGILDSSLSVAGERRRPILLLGCDAADDRFAVCLILPLCDALGQDIRCAWVGHAPASIGDSAASRRWAVAGHC